MLELKLVNLFENDGKQFYFIETQSSSVLALLY